MIKVNLEGKEVSVKNGETLSEALKEAGVEIPQDLIGIEINGELYDIHSPLTFAQSNNCQTTLLYLSSDSEKVRKFYRHSFSHILAQAVKRLYPDAKLAIGPAIAEGFYYDFDVKDPFTPEDLEKITKEMEKIIKEKHKFKRFFLSFEEAKKLLEEKGEPYKLELLEDIKGRGERVSFYQDGEFIDLCRGPHIQHTGQVRFFKLMEIAGAYWKGDERNKMLQRIYGTAFLKKEDLKEYLWKLEEAKKRDHRRLGKELDLFSINHKYVGGGLVLWHQKGAFIRHLIEEHSKKKHLEAGYDFVYTPHIGKSILWETSGHLQFFKENMYPPMEIEGQEYYLKPMNCPFHCQIYKSALRSYRELPMRLAEWGTVYRYERSGTLHGLSRVRGLTQDDAHLFCRPEQMPQEIDTVLSFSIGLLKEFGISEFKLYLSTRPEKAVGEEKFWNDAERALQEAIERSGLPYQINPGEGAFYGPKIDITVKDALDREWQLSTVQFDFNLPERFGLTYVGEDGREHRPYMIHRALLGTMERFFAVFIEYHAGWFPLWLCPVQVEILPITSEQIPWAKEVELYFKNLGIRAEVNDRNETLNYRIRASQKQKIPIIAIIGKEEASGKTVTLRFSDGANKKGLTLESAAKGIKEIIKSKAKASAQEFSS